MQMITSIFEDIENIVVNRGNADYQHFSPFPHSFKIPFRDVKTEGCMAMV